MLSMGKVLVKCLHKRYSIARSPIRNLCVSAPGIVKTKLLFLQTSAMS